MPTVLITGANRGLGLEFVKQYAEAGWNVLACCRQPDAATSLKETDGNVSLHALDVCDFGAVDQLAQNLSDTPIDVLINNAGAFGPRGEAISEISYGEWEEVLRINILAPTKIASAFLPHIEKSDQKKIVFISSIMGSVGNNSVGGEYIYRSSKAGLNGVIKSLSLDVMLKNIAVLALHPGWVQTDMGGANAAITPSESITGMRKVIDGLSMENTGQFYSYDGTDIPW
ncbi:SDR family oxidoreductase [Terasakiella sp. A23]|uniref:SDR family oxidoreductase n=1 Tax=Terasakiella sp. FCG-A23 TaxID=3080561 RepID=UPI002954F281|nr:SDR family oxidoreductase [Terasakiella sp. A23]MDV7341103.1 SDR family oxidoreductase [Terasakiella sp. A23]